MTMMGPQSSTTTTSTVAVTARELAQKVTRALAGLVPNPAAPRERDRRQDLLWDCARALQSARKSRESDALRERLAALPEILEDLAVPGFADRLDRWLRETTDLIDLPD